MWAPDGEKALPKMVVILSSLVPSLHCKDGTIIVMLYQRAVGAIDTKYANQIDSV